MSADEEEYANLHRAVLHGDLATVRKCLLRGVNPNLGMDSSILHTAVQEMPENCVQKIDLLVRQGNFDVNRRDSRGKTPLVCACASHNNNTDDVIAKLLELRADPNITSHSGASPLCKAAYHKAAEVVSLLLESNANVNPPISFSHDIITDGIHVEESPLYAAACRNDDDDTIAKILIERGALVNIPNCPRPRILDQAPLCIAVHLSHVRIARCLLKNGADPNVPSNLLCIASLAGNDNYHKLPIVQLLVEYGANVFAEDSKGRSIKDLLLERANEVVPYFDEGQNMRRRERLLDIARFLDEEMLLRIMRERRLAAVMAGHGRLGENSVLGRSLSRDMIDRIARVMD